ncbi:hypothetical protein B0T11DRAFT_90203 [Plectosphaerella cucumerina]|uniref:Uncharacterized protein n=1 Tax=Plectosphaerella cucumerina TaxID=40658 RepID=A0A8K0THX2_9PEZI|nr:hypothetical protein B0T11DRAFT_90203 [Plectosphaerella cucumerina]
MSNNDTVGSLLAEIATAFSDSLRVFNLADKSQWGPDEHEQRRRLAEALDEAKKDFQELSPLVHGQRYYMNDRRIESITELRTLRTTIKFHTENFRDWAKQGGPINPTWAVETSALSHELHRAQCRAARRIFDAERTDNAPRCLGAFLVYRKQRAWADQRARRKRNQQKDAEARARAAGTEPPTEPPRTPTQPHRHRRQGSTLVPSDDFAANDAAEDEYELQRQHMEELALCNSVGKFERFGDRDIAFVCDFCDGHIVWEDLESMPSIRTVDEEMIAAAPLESPTQTTPAPLDPSEGPPPVPAAAAPRMVRPQPPDAELAPGITHWQATGFTVSAHEEKSIVFAPLAIANHVWPGPGQWIARLRCPTCDEPPPDYTPPEGEEEDEGGGGWAPPDDLAFDDLGALQEHLEWQHTAAAMPAVSLPAATPNCALM